MKRSYAVIVTTALVVGVLATPAWADNVAPVLDDTKSPVMTAVEDGDQPVGAVGTPVADIVDLDSALGGLDNVTDPDASSGVGIAVVGFDAGLTCYATPNGGSSWGPILTVSAASALLLPPVLGRITCLAAADFEGTVTAAVTFRAWDLSAGSAGATVDTTTNGGSTAYSTATDTIALTVTGMNDAPTIDTSATPTHPDVAEDAPAPSGAVGVLVADLIDLDTEVGGLDNMSDIDSDAMAGLAVIGTDGGADCYWSLNDGITWFTFADVSHQTARLLAADSNNRIYCRALADLYGALEPLSFRAWDRSSGTDGGTGNAFFPSSTSAFSADLDYLTLDITPVPDAPQATNLSAAESYQPEIPLDLVDIVVTDPDDDVITATLTLSDPAAGVLSEATVLSTSSTYDENTGVWTAAGGVGVVNALLGGVTFTSAAGYTSTFEIDAEVSDGTDSLTGTKPMTLAPVTPVVSIGNASVVEGNVDTAKLQFALTLSAPTTVPVSVRVKTADGTAKAGSDYTARDTVVSIPAGQTTKSFTVLARGDTVVEIVERMSVRLSQPNGVTVGDGKGIGTITNDDRGLRVLTPNGGERWAAGTRHRISWVFGRLSGTLTIQLLRHGEVVRTITRDAVIGDAGRGSFSRKVPASTKVGRGYKIRLVSNKRPGQTDSSNRGFRITSG